jgi:hypothetical protein
MSRSSQFDVFADALISGEPHSALAPQNQIFAPFIGSWDLVVRWFDETGAVSRQQHGEWHFSWVLEGRAIQDVWIVPPRSERKMTAGDYEYGTSLRFYDRDNDCWQSTWIGPMHCVVRTFVARRIDDSVVLETTEGALPKMRWSFTEISPDAFSWRNEILENGDWRVQQTFEAERARAERPDR